LFFLTSCQKESSPVSDKDVEGIRTSLKADFENYLSTVDKSKLDNSTVIIVDSETGFSYSDDFGFARVNSYRQDAEGVMRNWRGDALSTPFSENFAKSVNRVSELSTQQIPPTQNCPVPIKYTPYRHVETREAKWNYIRSAFMSPGSGKEINQPCEAAYYGVLGVRNGGALTAEAGFYSSGAHWNSTTRQADYFGFFFAIAEQGVSPVFMDFSSQVPYNYYNPALGNRVVPKILYKMGTGYIRHMAMTVSNQPQMTDYGICSGTVPAYIMFEWEGPSPYLPNVAPLANWNYLIAVKAVKQKLTYNASCNASPAGFNFYRFTSLMSVDGASMRSSVSETSFNPQIGPGPAEWYMNPTNSWTNSIGSTFVPPGYAPHQNETCSVKQPANVSTIPLTQYPVVLSYTQNFSDYRIYMPCWTRYYGSEFYDINVTKIPQ
jgi:hypothetical protein